jgi:hypothetical protein
MRVNPEPDVDDGDVTNPVNGNRWSGSSALSASLTLNAIIGMVSMLPELEETATLVVRIARVCGDDPSLQSGGGASSRTPGVASHAIDAG